MHPTTVLYLSRTDVESVGVSMSDIVDAVQDMFKEKGEGRVEMPAKPGIHTRENAFIHAMPAYIPGIQSAGIKWISGYPDNQKKNLPYINGLLILNDTDTGIPIAIMDATWITAQRTGAATAVAAKYLARKDSSSVGILACGVQGRSNLEALSCVFKISMVKAFDIYPDVAARFACEMAEVVQTKIEVVNNPREAVVDMDLIVTSGPILKNPDPVIEAAWVAEGSFASAVDFDSYWKGEALRQADKFATDDLSQMGHYRKSGFFKQTPRPYADLGEIVVGTQPGRENENERTICMNLGLASGDMATAILIYRRAGEKGIGTRLPL